MNHGMRFFSWFGLTQHDSGITNRHFGVHDSTARSIHLHIELGVESLFQKLDQLSGIGNAQVRRYGRVSCGNGIRHGISSYPALYIRSDFRAVVLKGIRLSSFSVCQRDPLGAVLAIASLTVKR